MKKYKVEKVSFKIYDGKGKLLFEWDKARDGKAPLVVALMQKNKIG